MLIWGSQTLQNTWQYYAKCAKWQYSVLINILQSRAGPCGSRSCCGPCGCRDHEWWFCLLGFFLFLFSPLFYSVSASGWLLFGTWIFVQLLLSCVLLHFLLTKTLLHSHCQRFKWCLTKRWTCFHSYCPCSTLTCPSEVGISSSATTSIVCLHVFRARNGIYFPRWAFLCCAFKAKYDLINLLKTVRVQAVKLYAGYIVCCAGHVTLIAWVWSK